MFELDGARVLVAGGSSGVGLAAADLLIRSGASVVIGGRDRSRLESARKRLGDKVSVARFDATVPKERARALEQTGPIDHLVVALGGGHGAGPFAQVAAADIRTGFEAKFWPHFSLAQESLPYLNLSGSITFVTAIAARAAIPGTAGLSAINAAIEGLVRPLAVELRPRRVNAVSRGVLDTAAIPVGRVGRPQDVAEAILFLVGNSFMTGCVLECDGGLRFVSDETKHPAR